MWSRDEGRLLFVLARVDRLILLERIGKERLNLTELARLLSATAQETSRHLIRLRDAMLVEKDSEGFYNLSELGRLISYFLQSLSFLSSNKEYFASHVVSSLPQEFIPRLGEISECVYGNDVSTVLRNVERIIAESEQYLWFLGDQVLFSASSFNRYVSGKDVSMRVVLPSLFRYGEDIRKTKEFLGDKFDVRFVDDVKVGMVINEKGGGVVFPDQHGELDFGAGFAGANPNFPKWCLDFFNFYWRESKPSITAQKAR
jgi:predicted transcriptional regulator